MYKIAILLLFISTNSFGVTPETGWWWNPNEPGRGFNIEHQDGTVFIATFIYEENGIPIWYTTSGRLLNSTVKANMDKFKGGQCITCGFVSPSSEADGVAEFNFTTSRTGTLSWKGVEIPIQRFDFQQNRLGGSWLVGDSAALISIEISNVMVDSVIVNTEFLDFSLSETMRFVYTDSTIDEFTLMAARSKNGGDFYSSNFDNILLFSFKGPNKVEGLRVSIGEIFKQEITDREARKAFLNSDRFKEIVKQEQNQNNPNIFVSNKIIGIRRTD